MTCSLCARPVAVLAQGWCWAHYQRARRNGGDPHGSGKRLAGAPLLHGRYASYVAGCRCGLCTSAMRGYHKQRTARVQMGCLGKLVHGTQSTYTAGCRCDACRIGFIKAKRQLRTRAQMRLQQGWVEIVHDAWGYRYWGCRCDDCTEAHREDRRERDRAARLARGIRPRRAAAPRPRRIGRATKLAACSVDEQNRAFRDRELAAAIAAADGELAELIAAQARDHFQRESFTFSLDAPDWLGRDRHDLIGDEWADPTFDFVCEQL